MADRDAQSGWTISKGPRPALNEAVRVIAESSFEEHGLSHSRYIGQSADTLIRRWFVNADFENGAWCQIARGRGGHRAILSYRHAVERVINKRGAW